MPQHPAPIHSLPKELLALCLAPLSQRERFGSVALVSRSFHAASCSATTGLSVRLRGQDAMQHMQAFQSWLCKHAQHVQFLDVDVRSNIPSADREKITAALQQSLLLYGAAGQDKQLKLAAHSMLDNTHWLASMTKLCHADLGCSGSSMLVTPDIAGATSLHTLCLSGSYAFDPLAQLPASLTRLKLGICESFRPAQVALLTELQHWAIQWNGWNGMDTYDLAGFLAHLSKLTALCLDGFQELPDSLASLPHLKRLDLANGTSESFMALGLSKLTQLTSLSVRDGMFNDWSSQDDSQDDRDMCIDAACNIPLQRFALEFRINDSVEAEGCYLSPGPLQQTLRQLYVPVDLIPGSMEFLRGVQSLNDIVIYGFACPELARQLIPFWRWAAQHRPLRSMTLSIDESRRDSMLRSASRYSTVHGDDAEAVLLGSIVKLWQRRPELYVDRTCDRLLPAANAYFDNPPTR